MPDSKSHESEVIIAKVEYELTDDIACRSAVDLFEYRIPKDTVRFPAFGTVGPVVVLVGAAAQILIAIAALLFFGGWHWIVAKGLVVIGVMVVGILLWKAAFYSLPSLGRWYVCRQAIRHARRLAHRRIRWLLYEDRLETASASTQRKITWSEVSQMTTCGQSAILILRSGVELVIPAAVLSAEAESVIERRIAG
jgi:hypothetical protein